MKNKHILIPLMLLNVTFFIGAFLMSSYVSADDSVVDNVAVTVPASCTISGTGMTSHNATIPNGTYQADIGTTTLKALCNDTDGFAIYATGYTGNTIGETNSNKLVGTTNPSTTISTGTATSGNTSNWAMKLATSSSTTYPLTLDNGFGSYSSVPNSYTKVAHRDSATDVGTNAAGSTLTTTYAAYMNQTQAADTYSGQVIYTLVHPSSADAPVVPINIENAYSRAGKQKYNGYYKIQDMTPAICNIVNQYSENSMAEIIDVRDNNIYHIAKLADDNCWMLDNLALDPTNSTTASNMNETNTNASAIDIANFLNGGSNITGHSNVAVANVNSGFNSYTEPMINNTNKDTLVVGFGPASNNGQSKVGIYYNFCAATVGTYCYSMGSGVEELVSQDLCPAGWRMPLTGWNNNDYFELGVSLDIDYYAEDGVFYGDKVIDYAESFNTNMSGFYLNDSVRYLNSSGYWWSSLASYYSAPALRVDYYGGSNNLVIYDSAGHDRNVGTTMRCIASQTTGN